METLPTDHQDFCDTLDEMTRSLAATRETIRSLAQQDLATPAGISLLGLKHHALLAHLHARTLLAAHRAVAHTLSERTPPAAPFGTPTRGPRGSGAGDLVDALLEGRAVLEKTRALEGKMRYQIEKLVRRAAEPEQGEDDPLAFRPNPQNLVDDNASGSDSGAESAHREERGGPRSGVYRPPKLAPMPYTEAPRGKQARRPLPPAALSALAHARDGGTAPHEESASGLGGAPVGAGASARARELAHMAAFEEEHFTRLVMTKRDAARRRRDEEDVALGGAGARSRGFGGELADVLAAASGRRREGVVGDGYEELRQKGRKGDTLTRSRARSREEVDGEEDPREGKRGRFENQRKRMRHKMKR